MSVFRGSCRYSTKDRPQKLQKCTQSSWWPSQIGGRKEGCKNSSCEGESPCAPPPIHHPFVKRIESCRYFVEDRPQKLQKCMQSSWWPRKSVGGRMGAKTAAAKAKHRVPSTKLPPLRETDRKLSVFRSRPEANGSPRGRSKRISISDAASLCGQRWRFRVWVVRWREWGNHPRVN